MLKRFFISMLGTMAGIWISLFLVVVGGLMLVGVAVGKSAGDSAVKVEKKSVLVIDLTGVVEERRQQASFYDIIRDMDNKAPTLEEMIQGLLLAADDDRIEGLYIKCNGAAIGAASREELMEALRTFKDSGKWIYAYGDMILQSDYMIASIADNIFLNPVGSVDIHGAGGMVPFYKGLLDKIGVKMQIIKVGTFKSAVEPYVLTSMSEPARLQMAQYIDSIWDFTAGTIAENRGLPVDSIKALAPQMIYTRKAETFVADGLVDELAYERSVDDTLKIASGLSEKESARFIGVTDYVASSTDNIFGSTGEHIAVLYAVGEISDAGKEGIVGPEMVKNIIELADDDKVAGMVFRVNSPGGSAFASEQIWEALQYFKSKDKPLYVSMGDYAASGGYYISCGADRIFADRTTVTGSIGVFGMIPDFSGLVTDKLGVTFSTVETNPNATGIAMIKGMTPAQHAAMQQSVENIYDLFTARVADGRGMSQDSVKAIAEGRVWIGGRALELGLVDEIGSLAQCVDALADELDIDTDHVVSYPKTEQKMWEKIIMESGGLQDLKASDFDAEAARLHHFVSRLRDANPMQARMETVIME